MKEVFSLGGGNAFSFSGMGGIYKRKKIRGKNENPRFHGVKRKI